MHDTTVVVTGGSGFLGVHTIVQLLAAGHNVRTTIRSPNREADVRTMIAAAGVNPGDRLAFAIADLTSDDGWDTAVAGADYVLHMASPFPPAAPAHEDDLIVPARDGTLRVLSAARDAAVKRVVVTSSFAAIGYGHRGSGPFGETVWTNVDAPIGAYIKSKTLAEKAAWDFIETDGGAMELVVINPSGIFGPALGADYSSSLNMVKALLERQIPFLPDVTFGAVDVRDVSALHIQAMVDQRAIGQRIIAASAFTSMAEIASILRLNLGDEAARVPDRPIPTWLLKALAVFVKPLGEMASNAGTRREPQLGKARGLLGWSPRPLTETMIDTAHSLQGLHTSTGR
ncbi:MAG: NAD-dependent epimerase/dehydratase family protein [Mycobacterium sp.]|nr:NAD-dependent epimerase/dehydratase family protein [Mycobacterium sp.]